MRKIALEEHCTAPGIEEYGKAIVGESSKETLDRAKKLLPEFDEMRLRAMDEANIQISVLSQTAPGVHLESDYATARDKARAANDFLALQVERHPSRYRGFAHLAMHDAKQAGKELTRCVKELGFLGAMINGHTHGVYLDAPEYEDFWACVAELDVPIYLHPVNTYGMPYMLFERPELLGATWAWGLETATHALRLVMSGLFDRQPSLTIILGHMGETLPFALWRLDKRYSEHGNIKADLKMAPSEYVKRNMVITTSGVCDDIPLRCSIEALGIDNVLFSVDYPFESSVEAGKFIDDAKVSESEREKICFKNAEKILKIELDHEN